MRALHKRLVLFSDEKIGYTFVPADSADRSLTIQRDSGELVLNRSNTHIASRAVDSGRSIHGILGVISLLLSDYVVVITERERQGRLLGHDIFRAIDFDYLPISSEIPAQHPSKIVEDHLLALLKCHLKGGHFLFSYEWDLTRRLQAQWEAQETDQGKPMWKSADERFFWNRFIQSKFIEHSMRDEKQDLSPFILPVVYGAFEYRQTNVRGRWVHLCLISRRSRYRAGTRYFRRGIDKEGHVANFNESEQIVLVEGPQSSHAPPSDEFVTKMSYVQIRGSVPVFWAEINTMLYVPDLRIMDLQETTDALRKHLQEQIDTYGSQRLVNLVKIRGRERHVKEAYEHYVSQLNLPNVKYHHFDFHKECTGMKWGRISSLADRLADDMHADGWFQLDSSQPTPVRLQKGIVRTNCMDNLDRTNIVQTVFAKVTLNHQLQSLGLLAPNESIDDYESISRDFREVWADQGDLISKAYSGTGAMKADFTRTNKRTRAGVIEDGIKGLTRYFKNNYLDGPRQDAFDLFTGAWSPRHDPSTAKSLISDNRSLLTRSMPYIFWYSLFMIFAGLTLPRTSDYSLLYYFTFWFILLSLSLVIIIAHGIDYVAWPRLIPLTEVIYYDGPGFRLGNHGKGLGIGSLKQRAGTKDAKWKWLETEAHAQEMELGLKKRID